MKVDSALVKKVAALARLEFSEGSLASFVPEFAKIISYIEKINELPLEDLSPLSHPVGGEQMLREDKVKSSLSTSDALSNAPSKKERFFTVPRVLE
ncbi:MAG: aspartyl/glutamyl-tRNA(Asn/Gln) amidotransferase subunit C [candidate division Zixibacteria bacterium 4484_93]|nr:MAG: aspartyl/glutamyl-tRNA(Asn/Gln) amidotransferase subunit C [candidate division Zixibacteria bacterium 4484_93]